MWRCSETKIERIESGRDEAREIYNEAERERERQREFNHLRFSALPITLHIRMSSTRGGNALLQVMYTHHLLEMVSPFIAKIKGGGTPNFFQTKFLMFFHI